MQTFRVHKSSWHYKLYNQFSWSLPKDFCTYWRRVVLGSICIGAIFGFLGLLLYMFAHLVYLLALIVLANPVMILQLLLIVLTPFAVVALGWWLATKINKRVMKAPVVEKQPSIIVAKYRSWKHKYCPSIEYV